ncbi:MAG: methyltransferase domain-containing protein [Planctomycetes bacterium]|nr:methyltransferase domain-containing protein [Planctomycetota bacterium]
MAEEKRSFDHGGFWDSYAKRWDMHGDGDGVKRDGVLGVEWTPEARTQWVFDRFARPFIKSGAKVLEIGPGGGKFSRMLTDAGVELTLCDISPVMLERAASVCSTQPHTALLDGTGLQPFADNTFDLVFSFDVFIHIEAEEFYRYLAEANRVLKTGGVFSVHTSTFESQYGMLAFLRQMRDHHPQIGTRYGGRMYPLTGNVLSRFAEHNGFVVTDRSESWEDRDLVQAFTKTTRAWPWIFITRSELYEKMEICERKGGSPSHPLYAVFIREDGREALMEIGAKGDPLIAARAAADVPLHKSTMVVRGKIQGSDFDAVIYDYSRGVSLRRLLADPQFRIMLDETSQFVSHLFVLVDGMQTAHKLGYVHGEISTETIFADDTTQALKLPGVHRPKDSQLNDLIKIDREAMAAVLRSVDLPPWAKRRTHDAARLLEANQFKAQDFL